MNDVDRVEIEALVDHVTFEIEASRGSVSAGFSPEAREDIDALLERLVEAGIERVVANKAVDRLILTRRPIVGCIEAAVEDVTSGR